jgi:hypothetical protein
MKNDRWSNLGVVLFLLSALWLFCTCGGEDDASSEGGSMSEKKAISLCEDMMTAYCEKMFECSPELAGWLYDAADASGCAAEAKRDCAEDGEEDDGDDVEDPAEETCEPTEIPSDSLIEACIEQLENTTCEELDSLEESGPCAEINAMDTCDDDEEEEAWDTQSYLPADTDYPTDFQLEVDTETGLDPQNPEELDTGSADPDDSPDDLPADVEIHTEGCVAAVQSVCTVAATCADGLATVPPRVSQGVEGCPAKMDENADTLNGACQTYLEEQVPLQDPVALYLNSASAAEIEACVGASECDLVFLTSLVDGLSSFLASGEADDLAALITPLLTGACPI